VRVAPASETSPSEAANAPDEDAAREDETSKPERGTSGRDGGMQDGAGAGEPTGAPR
jgi:hypothetical protein